MYAPPAQGPHFGPPILMAGGFSSGADSSRAAQRVSPSKSRKAGE